VGQFGERWSCSIQSANKNNKLVDDFLFAFQRSKSIVESSRDVYIFFNVISIKIHIPAYGI
jgi:hypothetical protein